MGYSTVKIHSSAEPTNTQSQKSTVLMRYDPTTLRELFASQNFYSILAKSFVFIHNKKGASDCFQDVARNFMHPFFEFQFFKTHLTEPDSIFEKIETLRNSSGSNYVYVIDLTSSVQNIQTLCWRLLSMQNRPIGIWVKGYISDLSPSLISAFDAMFVFDISDTEYEILRSVIKLPLDIVRQMRFEASRYFLSDRVLFFANQSQLPDLPRFIQNPKVLRMPDLQREGEKIMNISDFMPVIVEASKFLFNVVSGWIDDVRKKAPSTNKPKIDLLVYKKPVEQLENNPASVTTLINSAVTEEMVDEIQSLVEQIKLTRSVLSQLEKQVILATGEEEAKINVIIREKARIILEKVERLNALLSTVYLDE